MSIADSMAQIAVKGPAPRGAKPEAKPGAGPEENEQVGHELMRMAHDREPAGKHTHVHHNDDGTHTSHHVDSEGNISGPVEHQDTEALKAHIGQYCDGDSSDDDSPQTEHDGLM